MKSEQNVPQVRFKGFTDAWEQRELGEIMDITSVKRIHQSDWTDSGIRFLRARDIVSAFKGEEPSDYLYISEEKYNEYTALSGKVKVGDLLVTGVGTIGVPMLINSDNPIYFKDGNIIWFKNENKIDGQFFYYSFTNTGIQSYISESSGKGTVGTYTIESGKKTPILLPQNMEEQKAIGTYFRNLDTLITLHQRKCDTLQKLKKSMLQKMFPKNGSLYPEIRFAGFTDAWEQRELGTITSSYSGGTPTAGKSEYYGGDIPFIRSGEIDEEKTELFLSELGYNNSSAAMVEKGDILYALYGATSGEVSISKLKGAINQAILAIKPNEGYDSEFMMQWLKNQKDNIISTYLQGGQGNLSGAIVKSLKVDITTYEEQQQIGTYFRNLDTLITLHQRKLETLKKLKKSMLQKMFI